MMNRMISGCAATVLAFALLHSCDKGTGSTGTTTVPGPVAAAPSAPTAPSTPAGCAIYFRHAESSHLWQGTKNRIEISAPIGSIVKTPFSSDTIHVCPQEIEITPSDTHSIKIEIIRDGQSLSAEVFKVRQVPDPVPYINNEQSSGSIVMTKSDLSSIRTVGLKSIHPDCPFNLVEFTSVTNVNGVFVEYKSAGKLVSGDMAMAFATIRTGAYVSLHNIVAKGCDGSLRRLPPILIKVR